MAKVIVYSYFVYGTFEAPNVTFLKMLLNERVPLFPLDIGNFDIFVNGNNVFTHNTPLFEGDVVRIVQKEI